MPGNFYGSVMLIVTAGEVTVPVVPGAEAVALTVTGAGFGDKFACVTRNPCPVQVAVLVLVMPASAILF